MKKLVLAALVSFVGSAAMAEGMFVCNNASFTIQLVPVSQTQLKLTVTAVKGAANVYMPKEGETASLTVDSEVSKGERIILRSELKNGEIRGYEVNLPAKEILKPSFKASVNVARENGDSQFLSYAILCQRK